MPGENEISFQRKNIIHSLGLATEMTGLIHGSSIESKIRVSNG
jgi:hypothetical protein